MLDKVISQGVLLAVVFTALAYGTVEAWSLAIFELLIALLVLLWAIRIARGGAAITVPSVALPLAGLIVAGAAQSFAWSDANGARAALSLDVEATRGATIGLAFMLAAMLLAANFTARRERLRGLGGFLVFYGLALAVFALIQHFTWAGEFYWFRETRNGTLAFGPFVNRNHFAGYMAMLAPLAASMAADRHARPELRGMYAFAAAMMSVALVASLSRGGMISLAAGLIFVAVAAPRRAALRRRAPALLMRAAAAGVFVVVIAAGVVWVGADPVVARMTETVEEARRAVEPENIWERPVIWRHTVEMIAARPVFGSGLGAYATAYPMFGRGDGRLELSQAHNDYLQVLADAGLIGGGLAVWFTVAVFGAVRRGVQALEPHVAWVAAGAGGGLTALLVHSLFDFNLQIPSNALLFLVLAVMASSAGERAEAEDRHAEVVS